MVYISFGCPVNLKFSSKVPGFERGENVGLNKLSECPCMCVHCYLVTEDRQK